MFSGMRNACNLPSNSMAGNEVSPVHSDDDLATVDLKQTFGMTKNDDAIDVEKLKSASAAPGGSYEQWCLLRDAMPVATDAELQEYNKSPQKIADLLNDLDSTGISIEASGGWMDASLGKIHLDTSKKKYTVHPIHPTHPNI